MDFFRGLTGSSSSSDPPASVLAEWNKYSGGDIESGSAPTADAQQPSFLAGFLQQSLLGNASAGTNTASASMATYGTTGRGEGWSSQSFSLRIPSGTNFVYFAALAAGALIFFTLAFFIFLPLLVLSPGKFALSFTFGSLCTMAAMIMLSGWQAGLAHLASREKLPFSSVYVGSMAATLYAALWMHSYLLSILFSGVQVVALLYYVMSYFPGGTQGLRFALSMAGRAIVSCFGSFVRGSS